MGQIVLGQTVIAATTAIKLHVVCLWASGQTPLTEAG